MAHKSHSDESKRYELIKCKQCGSVTEESTVEWLEPPIVPKRHRGPGSYDPTPDSIAMPCCGHVQHCAKKIQERIEGT
jgi:hypothetical protein